MHIIRVESARRVRHEWLFEVRIEITEQHISTILSKLSLGSVSMIKDPRDDLIFPFLFVIT